MRQRRQRYEQLLSFSLGPAHTTFYSSNQQSHVTVLPSCRISRRRDVSPPQMNCPSIHTWVKMRASTTTRTDYAKHTIVVREIEFFFRVFGDTITYDIHPYQMHRKTRLKGAMLSSAAIIRTVRLLLDAAFQP